MKKEIIIILAVSICLISILPLAFAEELAHLKTVTADTEYSGGFIAEYAVDGDNSTRWCSVATGGVPHWIYVDLNDTYQVTGVNILFELSFASNFTIEKSFNEIAWTTVLDNQTGVEGWVNVTFAENNGRYWRITGVTNPLSALSIFEFEIIGDTVPVPTPTPVATQTPTPNVTETDLTMLYTVMLFAMICLNIAVGWICKGWLVPATIGIISISIAVAAFLTTIYSYILFSPWLQLILLCIAIFNIYGIILVYKK